MNGCITIEVRARNVGIDGKTGARVSSELECDLPISPATWERMIQRAEARGELTSQNLVDLLVRAARAERRKRQ